MREYKVIDAPIDAWEDNVSQYLSAEGACGWSLVAVCQVKFSSTKYHRYFFDREKPTEDATETTLERTR